MTSPRRRETPADPISTGLYTIHSGSPQAMVPGDAMRATPCLVCGRAIGKGPAVTVMIALYVPARDSVGNIPSSAWLVHADHPRPGPRGVWGLAQWRLAKATPAGTEGT